MVQAFSCEKKNFPGTIILWGEQSFFRGAIFREAIFWGDTIPGGNFPAGSFLCTEYKQDHFFNECGNNY